MYPIPGYYDIPTLPNNGFTPYPAPGLSMPPGWPFSPASSTSSFPVWANYSTPVTPPGSIWEGFDPSVSAQPRHVEFPRPVDVLPKRAPVNEVKASHILVETQAEAEALRRQIIAGRRFEDAAKASKCPSGKKGGDLGFFSRGDMVPEFEREAFTLPVGAISKPFKTDFGWHILRVTEQR